MNARATPRMLLCVFVVAEQATVEQAKMDDEAEMTQGKVAGHRRCHQARRRTH